jgi:hypothetical protein
LRSSAPVQPTPPSPSARRWWLSVAAWTSEHGAVLVWPFLFCLPLHLVPARQQQWTDWVLCVLQGC